MSNRFTIVVPLILTLTAASSAWAHAGHSHTIMGTVVNRDAKAVEVKTPSGEVLSLAITPETAVVRGKKKAAIAEVNKGVRVVIDIGDGEDPLIAHEIRLGAAPAAK